MKRSLPIENKARLVLRLVGGALFVCSLFTVEALAQERSLCRDEFKAFRDNDTPDLRLKRKAAATLNDQYRDVDGDLFEMCLDNINDEEEKALKFISRAGANADLADEDLRYLQGFYAAEDSSSQTMMTDVSAKEDGGQLEIEAIYVPLPTDYVVLPDDEERYRYTIYAKIRESVEDLQRRPDSPGELLECRVCAEPWIESRENQEDEFDRRDDIDRNDLRNRPPYQRRHQGRLPQHPATPGGVQTGQGPSSLLNGWPGVGLGQQRGQQRQSPESILPQLQQGIQESIMNFFGFGNKNDKDGEE